MKIDVTKIEGYAEMTPEAKITALENFEYEDVSKLKVDNEKLKKACTDASADASKYKKELQARMSAEEQESAKRAEEEQKRNEELNSLRRTVSVSQYAKRYMAQGYSAELAESSAEALFDGDMEKVFQNNSLFIEERDKQKSLEALKKTPLPPSGNLPPSNKDEMTDAEYYASLKKG